MWGLGEGTNPAGMPGSQSCLSPDVFVCDPRLPIAAFCLRFLNSKTNSGDFMAPVYTCDWAHGRVPC